MAQSKEVVSRSETSIVPLATIEAALATLKQPEFQEALRDITVFDLPRVTVGTGQSGDVLRFANGEREIAGVILKVQPNRVFWGTQPVSATTRPICISRDAVVGEPNTDLVTEFYPKDADPKPGGKCLACPFAGFGSIKLLNLPNRARSNAKACDDVRLVYVLQPMADGSGRVRSLPSVVKCAPSSLRNLRRYQAELMLDYRTVQDVVTHVTLDPGHSADGNDYAVMRFRSLDVLDEQSRAAIAAYKQEIEPFLAMAPIIAQEDVWECPDCHDRIVLGGEPIPAKCPSCGAVQS